MERIRESISVGISITMQLMTATSVKQLPRQRVGAVSYLPMGYPDGQAMEMEESRIFDVNNQKDSYPRLQVSTIQ